MFLTYTSIRFQDITIECVYTESVDRTYSRVTELTGCHILTWLMIVVLHCQGDNLKLKTWTFLVFSTGLSEGGCLEEACQESHAAQNVFPGNDIKNNNGLLC